MREALREGLKNWSALPESDRKPGAVQVPDHGPVDKTFHREPPANGLIVKVFARALDRGARQDFSDAVCQPGAGDEAGRDHLWLSEAEWKSLLPVNPRVGDVVPIDAKIIERILRFHLVDNTRGEPPIWNRGDIRKREITARIESAGDSTVRIQIDGAALLATAADPGKADRGFDAAILGCVEYQPREQRITRFDLVAVGDHWGSGTYTRRRARPGKTPLGIAFELTDGKSAADRIAPQAARDINGYFGR